MRLTARKRVSEAKPVWHLVRRGSHLVAEGLITVTPSHLEAGVKTKQIPCIFGIESVATCKVQVRTQNDSANSQLTQDIR